MGITANSHSKVTYSHQDLLTASLSSYIKHFRQQWQRTKWILRPLEPHPRAPLEHLLLTRYIFLRFSERRSAFHHHHGRHQSSGLVLIPTSFDNDISSSRRNIETSEKSDRRMHHHHHHQHGVHL